MFSSMFKSLVSVSNGKRTEEYDDILKSKTYGTAVQNVDDVFALLNEIQEESDDDDSTDSEMSVAGIRNGLERFSIGRDFVVDNFDENKINNNFIGGNKPVVPMVEDPDDKLFHRIESLQCLFTWKLKSQKDQDIILRLKKKYGDINLDMSLPEFTFVRFIGNLIISYELNQNGKSVASDTKMLEIGSWLEKLDKGTDEFYLSINDGLKHIRTANFVCKQFAKNETGGLKWLFNEVVPFENMDTKSKAAVYAVHAVILIEYGENINYFKNARKYACKACELDPDTSHWFHIYSLVLIAQRQFIHSQALYKTKNQLYTNDECPTEKNINLAIQRAIVRSEGKCTYSVDSFLLTTLSQYLSNENQLALNGFLNKSNPKYIVEKNKTSNLDEDMKVIVEKHNNGENALPYLTVMISKYDEQDKWKILAQICSYTILYTDNFRTGVEQFLMLIEEMENSSRHLVTNHNSSFIGGSKIFNLAELIFNEIRLVTKKLSTSSFKDALFYYKMFFKIKDTCGLNMKIIDPAMRIKLTGCQSSNWFLHSNTTHQYKTNLLYNKSDLSVKSTYSSTMYQNEIDLSDNVIDCTSNSDGKSITLKLKTGNRKSRRIHLQNVSAKATVEKSKSKNRARYRNKKSLITSSTKLSLSKMYRLYLMNFQLKNISSKIEFCNERSSVLLGNDEHFQTQTDILNIFQAIDQTTDTIKTNFASNQLCVDMSLANLPRVLTSQAIYKAFLENILRNYPNSFRIYTDASRIQNSVGIAIVSSKDTFSYKLSSDYTSSDAEAVAILRALDYALTENYYDFVILSDSLSTISCIHNQNTSSDVIKSILCLLHAHWLKGNKMGFIWIPSHNAIEGNEKADKLAKQIALSTTALTYSHNSFMATNIKYKSL